MKIFDGIVWIDSKIIDHVFQPIANRFEGIIGPGAIAANLLMGASVMAVGFMGMQVSEGKSGSDLAWTGLIVLSSWYMWWAQNRQSKVDSALSAERHIPLFILNRVFWIALLLNTLFFTNFQNMGIGQFLLRTCQALTLLAFYFAACRKPPPRKRTEPKGVFGRVGAR